MQLHFILAPCSGFDHQVTRFLPQPAIVRFVRTIGIVAYKILEEECTFLSCLRIVCGQRVPPPIISLPGLTTKQLALVSAYIVFVKHR